MFKMIPYRITRIEISFVFPQYMALLQDTLIPRLN